MIRDASAVVEVLQQSEWGLWGVISRCLDPSAIFAMLAQDYIESKPRGSRIMVFVGTRTRCDWLTNALSSPA